MSHAGVVDRAVERRLLLLAIVIGAGGMAMVHVARYREMPWTPVVLGTAALVAFLIPHVILARRRDASDTLVLSLVAVLVGIGLTMIYRLDPGLLLRQIVWVGTGLMLMMAILVQPDVRWLARYKYVTGALSVLLLAGAVVLGVEVGGTRQWIRLGSLTFQPSETVKVLLVAFFAAYLWQKRPLLQLGGRPLATRYAGPLFALAAVILLLLVAQRDLGAGLLLFTVTVVMLYAATGRARYLVAGFLLLAAGAVIFGRLFPHVGTRILAWRNPWADLAGAGYQVAQGLFALGSGGLTGTGLGLGHPEILPAAATDLIFAAIGEELGLAGTLAILAVLMVLVGRAVRLAVSAASGFEALLAGGLAAILGLQSFIIVGGILRLIPLTGVTLPFVSYGGNSLVSSLAIVGLLLRIGHARGGPAARDVPARPAGEEEAADALLLPLRWRLRALGAGLIVLLAATTLALGWWHAIAGPALAAHPANPRLLLAEQAIVRGTIYDRRLRVLAETVEVDGALARRYPQGPLTAHLVGYRSLRYGKSGLEAAFDARLLGLQRRTVLQDALDRLLGRRPHGDDLVLTIDLDLQRAAALALGERRGAIVVVDPRSGAVLAAVSRPAFDPSAIDESLPQLRGRADAPLLDRTAQAVYPPGSAFKVVTMAAGLRSGRVTPDTIFVCPGYIYIRKTRVTDFEERAHGRVDLRRALVRSCNISFIKAGLQMGGAALHEAAKLFGIGSTPRYELPAAAGHLPSRREMTDDGVGQAAFGQGSLTVSPLQMALVAAVFANGGTRFEPYLVAEVRDPSGRIRSVHRPAGRQALESAVTGVVAETMVDVVRRGTGRAARLAEVEIAGKTGTAEHPGGETHAWFIAFAPVEAPRLALAVVVEEGGIGGRVAAPIAREVVRAALRLPVMTAP